MRVETLISIWFIAHLPSQSSLCAAAAEIGERQDEDREARRDGFLGRELCLGGLADFQRIDPDRLGDVLELHGAEIADREIEPPLDLPIGVLGKTDCAGRVNAFEPRGDIDTVAHQVAVALFDHVAEMNADAELDPPFGWQAGVALDEAVLHFDRAAHGVDHAAELDQAAVPGSLENAPVMRGDGGIDQIAAQPPRSSSAPASRLYPATSATRIAAIFRVSLIAALRRCAD